ncbi:MAG: hypothetical protein IJZ56_03390 [Oscillospiraceae bacterium]|nr:hypothetical protein [Oscillospiraceae bacterium]
MYDTYKMQEHICRELEKKAEGGLKSTSDLDTVWKLIDAYKNLLKIDMLQEADEYSHEGGYSERRRRDSRGRYSRNDGMSYDDGSSYRRGYSRDGGYSEARERYMDDKHSYRSTRSPESKREMGTSLHECMTKLKEELQDMMSNADTREERDKIKEMIQEIGRLA